MANNPPDRSASRASVARAARELYGRNARSYVQYRLERPHSSEAQAWAKVSAFVSEHGLGSYPLLDIGCGYGPPISTDWSPKRYLGADLSSHLLSLHRLREMASTTLLKCDLNNPPEAIFDWAAMGQTLVIAVLSLHYLDEPANIILRLGKRDHRFCFVIPNHEHDVNYALPEGLVERDHSRIRLRYFSRPMYRYVEMLGSPRQVSIEQCGDSGAYSQPYFIIGGKW
jgi:hypothetical protein